MPKKFYLVDEDSFETILSLAEQLGLVEAADATTIAGLQGQVATLSGQLTTATTDAGDPLPDTLAQRLQAVLALPRLPPLSRALRLPRPPPLPLWAALPDPVASAAAGGASTPSQAGAAYASGSTGGITADPAPNADAAATPPSVASSPANPVVATPGGAPLTGSVPDGSAS